MSWCLLQSTQINNYSISNITTQFYLPVGVVEVDC